MKTQNDLLNDLIYHTHAEKDRHGEYHLTCPECGHVSSPKSPHCSFSDKGWFCFVCGAGGSLTTLAQKLGLSENRPYQAPVRAQERPRAESVYPVYSDGLVSRYEAHSARYELWRKYKPISVETIRRKQLGVGALPQSRCRHERLIVPIFDGAMLVGLRGRAIHCTCGKWLVAGGTTLDMLPIYNGDALRQGDIVWIVENPVDALLISEKTPFTGVAIYSVSYWRDAWLETLQSMQPEWIIVALDNDLVGNGGAQRRQEFIHDWLKTHPRTPEPRGVKLANLLNRAGLQARLFDWGRAVYKADIGGILATGAGV